MPNLIKNVLKFKNLTPNSRDIILNLLTEYNPDTNIHYIDFNKIVPEPETVEECDEEYRVNSDKPTGFEILKDKPWFDWYKWHCDNWGTKWNAYDGFTIIGTTTLTMVFTTAWTYPEPILDKLHLLGYDIEFRYAEEFLGGACGKILYTQKDGWSFPEVPHPDRFQKYIWEKY